VKAFKRVRKLKKGDAFKATLTLDTSRELDPEDYQEIAKRVRRSFKGLSNQDIYITAMQNGKRKVIGRASSLVPSEIVTT
jgi:divalent metal cation (Fe/Co/Zn/Cd) transporter